jgi:hypothetical protein
LPIVYKLFELILTDVARDVSTEIRRVVKDYLASFGDKSPEPLEALQAQLRTHLRSEGVADERLDKAVEAITAVIQTHSHEIPLH